MKSFLILFSILTSTASIAVAQFDYSDSNLQEALRQYDDKSGMGYYVIKGIGSNTKRKCTLSVTRMPDYISTGQHYQELELVVGKDSATVDLRGWSEVSAKSRSKIKKFTRIKTRNNCNSDEIITINLSKDLVTYSQKEVCGKQEYVGYHACEF